MQRYRRILLKLSGEAFLGSASYGIEEGALVEAARKLVELKREGYQVACVVGGGNIFRGLAQGSLLKMERTEADGIGMLATMMNGAALVSLLKKEGVHAKVLSALPCEGLFETYKWDRADEYLERGELIVLVAGTGHSYFTTDTAAALRAAELGADILLKATLRVDGIYDRDPRKESGAMKYDKITYREILEKKLGILDLTAVTLCMTNQIPIRVFNFFSHSLVEALGEKPIGTLVSGD